MYRNVERIAVLKVKAVMKTAALCFFPIFLAFSGYSKPPYIDLTERPEQMVRTEKIETNHGYVLQGSDRLSTPETFRPPVEITIVAKTDSRNLRISYAADQVIFNWEENEDELRVDGGPADGRHTGGAGRIPTGKYVTIQWNVTPQHQDIYVDGELRFEHCGDYSAVDKPITVFPALGSKVTVKSITVKQLNISPALQLKASNDKSYVAPD